MVGKTNRTEEFWRAFAEYSRRVDYVVVAFGDNPRMATELAALVASGTKRATASLVSDFSSPDSPLPKIGDSVVVVDGNGSPQCIYRTTEIEIKPLISVDDRFAWDEGEGDRTRDWWLAAHRRYFGQQTARVGFDLQDDIETVFERFEVVWPLSLADRSKPLAESTVE
jgi:uncharacterized protein YhfF